MTKVRVDFNRFVLACGLARAKGDKQELLILLRRISDGTEPPITPRETKTLLDFLAPKRGRRTESVTPKGDFMRYAVRLQLHAEQQLRDSHYDGRDIRQEAERHVIEHLLKEGYDSSKVKGLGLRSARRRGRKAPPPR